MSLSTFSRSFTEGFLQKQRTSSSSRASSVNEISEISEDESEFAFDIAKSPASEPHSQQPSFGQRYSSPGQSLPRLSSKESYHSITYTEEDEGRPLLHTTMSYYDIETHFLMNDYHTHDLSSLFKLGWLAFTLGYGFFFASSLHTLLGIMTVTVRIWLAMASALLYLFGSIFFMVYALKLRSRKIRDATFLGSLFFLLGSICLSFFTFVDLAEFYDYHIFYMRREHNELIDSQLESDVL
eukprot:Awhi_evm1s12028